MPVKVRLARRLDPVHALAEVNPVHVTLDDLVLGEILLDADGEKRLQQLAIEAADMLAAEESIERELLRERAAACLMWPCSRSVTNRTRDAYGSIP